jgi:hypothetical protein
MSGRNSAGGVKLAPILPAAQGHSQHSNNVGGHLAQPRGSALGPSSGSKAMANAFSGRKQSLPMPTVNEIMQKGEMSPMEMVKMTNEVRLT